MSKEREALKQALEACGKVPTMSVYATEKLREVENILREALAEQPAQCQHRIADARNPVVKSGYLCVDCGALFSAADHTEQPAQQQEPVAYIHRQGNHWEVSERFLCDDEKARGWTEEPLYTAPPASKPLTDEQIKEIMWQKLGWTGCAPDDINFARAIEAAHGIKGDT